MASLRERSIDQRDGEIIIRRRKEREEEEGWEEREKAEKDEGGRGQRENRKGMGPLLFLPLLLQDQKREREREEGLSEK